MACSAAKRVKEGKGLSEAVVMMSLLLRMSEAARPFKSISRHPKTHINMSYFGSVILFKGIEYQFQAYQLVT